jgi:hypothetical protein
MKSSGIEVLDMNSNSYTLLIFYKGTKIHKMEKKKGSSTNVDGKTGYMPSES